jgi:hypothetical protein
MSWLTSALGIDAIEKASGIFGKIVAAIKETESDITTILADGASAVAVIEAAIANPSDIPADITAINAAVADAKAAILAATDVVDALKGAFSMVSTTVSVPTKAVAVPKVSASTVSVVSVPVNAHPAPPVTAGSPVVTTVTIPDGDPVPPAPPHVVETGAGVTTTTTTEVNPVPAEPFHQAGTNGTGTIDSSVVVPSAQPSDLSAFQPV